MFGHNLIIYGCGHIVYRQRLGVSNIGTHIIRSEPEDRKRTVMITDRYAVHEETFSQQSILPNLPTCFNTQQAEAMKAEVDLTD